jgi:hypothetical protein
LLTPGITPNDIVEEITELTNPPEDGRRKKNGKKNNTTKIQKKKEEPKGILHSNLINFQWKSLVKKPPK